MGGEWDEVTIEDIACRIAMGPFGSDIKTDSFVATGVPVIRGTNLTSGRFRAEDFVFLTEEKADELANANAYPGDVVFTHRGTLGQIGLVPDQPFKRYVVSQSQMKLTCDAERANPLFVYYFFKSPAGQHALLMNTSQTGVPAISRPVTSLKAIRLPLPPMAEQRAIAHTLGTLDDKIKLNRRMNETLEAIARALFKSWFVDFDPVRAKAEGRHPGLPPHLADLFPDRFEDSELGEIPVGWSIGRLGDHVEAERGLSYAGKNLRNDGCGLPMHNLNSIYEGGGYKHEGLKFYDGEYSEKHVVVPGDMIVTNTEQGFYHLLIGHAAIVPDRYGPVGLYSHHIFRIRTKPASPFTPHYLVQMLNDPRWHELIAGFSNGTTINMLPLDALALPRVIVPPPPVVAEFSRVAGDIHARVELTHQESLTLARYRDGLLPKLISGELRVGHVGPMNYLGGA